MQLNSELLPNFDTSLNGDDKNAPRTTATATISITSPSTFEESQIHTSSTARHRE